MTEGFLWIANNSDFEVTDSYLKKIKETFSVPSLTQNMRNVANISRAANEPVNSWDNYPDGPKPTTITWNRNNGPDLKKILQQALEEARTDYKNLLILPLKDDLRQCYELCEEQSKREAPQKTVCLYGTSEGRDAESIPELNDKLRKKIAKKDLTVVSSMYFAQGTEFKTVIAFVPTNELRDERTSFGMTEGKYFLTRKNMLLRAVVNLVIVDVL